ncbi:MAG: HAMP domain-containing sensor histidine kinase [Bacteroidota bacterium]
MQQKTIYLIIGLIAAAVIGVIWLQLDLIKTGLEVSEERYDKAVQTALKQVAEDQETQEEIYINLAQNGFNSPQRNIGGGISPTSPLSGTYPKPNAGGILKLEEQRIFKSSQGIGYLRTSFETSHLGMMEYYHNLPLEKRINLTALTKSLKTELTNQRIEGKVEYGVFDQRKQRFIIHDGQYLNEEMGDTSRFVNLYQSQHKVSLFDNAGESAGFLLATFSERDTAIWSDLRLNLLASLLFALIILSCVGYTLYVIYRQKQLSDMKTDFINNMTHEFKTPIATISLATESITNPKISGYPDKVARFANIIKQENKRMNKQVEKVLQMAKLDKNELKLNLAPVDLHEVINNAVQYISLQVDPRGGRVTTQLAATPHQVEGDVTHLSNVINNLLDNANKYSPETPTIHISTRQTGSGMEVAIKDQGLGMNKEALKHIFDRFYRVNTGDRHDVKGFGLGLSYVKTIVEAHHGKIKVKSEPGKGSCFTLYFPYRQTK